MKRVAQAGGIPLDPDDIIHVEHNQGSIFLDSLVKENNRSVCISMGKSWIANSQYDTQIQHKYQQNGSTKLCEKIELQLAHCTGIQ